MEKEKRYCDSCGKCMTFPGEGGSDYIGATILLACSWDTPDEEILFMKNQIAPYELNREYAVCWSCLLKSYGVKPK